MGNKAIEAGSASLMGTNLLAQICPPAGDILQQDLYNIWPTKLPEVGALIQGVYRDYITKDVFIKVMRNLGFDTLTSEYFLELYKEPLSIDLYLSLYWRGVISQDSLRTQFIRAGFKSEEFDLFTQGMQLTATPSDLVRFAVREVYTTEIVQQYGLDEDFPEIFMRETAKIGMQPELAHQYWQAHWELPSISQGYEMYWRGIITLEELKILMKSLDIMPFWRDKLIRVAYNPITRVDVRRMYRLGVLSFDDMIRRYMDLGYAPDDARLLADFTQKYESGEDKGITRGSVLKAYIEGIIVWDVAHRYLMQLDYSDEVIAFWKMISDNEIMMEQYELLRQEAIALYRKGVYTFEEFKHSLTGAGLPPDLVNKTIMQEKVSTAKSLRIPNEDIIWQWYTLHIITKEEFVLRYRRLGYNETDIILFLEQHEQTAGMYKVKFMPLNVYGEWYKEKLIGEDTIRARLTAMGMIKSDIDTQIRVWNKDMKEGSE